ncbi:hypothetical protein [Hydrogenophaga sp.]|uniref:hypothetical protein n=1 Tax=Hydrogenophaga sp. TaxID=1904254 RepID=UPI0025BF890A|nr:hypothetical protein [Hydrogenophaga sp.]
MNLASASVRFNSWDDARIGNTMTVKDLIEALKQAPQDATVYAYNCDTETDEQVCGLLIETNGAAKAVTVCTADN